MSERASTSTSRRRVEVEADQRARERRAAARPRRRRWSRRRTAPLQRPPPRRARERVSPAVGVGRQQDRVRGGVEPAGAQAGEVGVAAAGGVAKAVLVAGEDVLRRRPPRPAPRGSGPAGGRAKSASDAAAATPGPSSPIRSRRVASAGRVELGLDRGVAPAPPLRVAPRRVIASSGAYRGEGASSLDSVQGSLEPVQRFVEHGALAAAHHRRAEPREAPQRLRGGQRHRVSPSPSLQRDIDLVAAQVALERRARQLLLPDRSARRSAESGQRKSARTPRPSAVPSTLVHCCVGPSPSTLSTRIVRGHQRGRL